MTLPTDPFAAPSSGPLELELARADDPVRAMPMTRVDLAVPPWADGAGPNDDGRRRGLRLALVATGAVAVGVAAAVLITGRGATPPSAAATLDPAAGDVVGLAPPSVGPPIVPREVTAPVVTTSRSRAPESLSPRPERSTERSGRSRSSQGSERGHDAGPLASAIRSRAAQARAEAREEVRGDRADERRDRAERRAEQREDRRERSRDR